MNEHPFENNLIVIGSTLAYYFPADYIKQTAKLLSRTNTVIVFLWGDALSIKEILLKRVFSQEKFRLIHRKEGVCLFTPIHIFPFRRFEFIQKLNLIINVSLFKFYIRIKKLSSLKKILWIFNYKLCDLPRLMGKSYLSLYDCVEYPSSFDKKTEEEIRTKEFWLIQSVDLFFVDSPTLHNVHRKFSPHVVPQGFDLDTFEQFSKKKRVDVPSLPMGKPTIGYVGSINYRLDFRLLVDLVSSHPEWNFVFVGQRQNSSTEDPFVRTDHWLGKLFRFPNVFMIENQPKAKLPQLISQFDVYLIPHNVGIKFNLYSRAMKLYEYGYFGKPIISTPTLESLRLSPPVLIANNAEGFAEAIKRVLHKPLPQNYGRRQRQLALMNSWQKKITYITQTIQSRPV